VQIVLHRRAVVEAPENPLLVVVDINSEYGVVVHFWCAGCRKLVKTVKLRPPNLSSKRGYAREVEAVRDRLYNMGCITEKQINIYSALVRKSLSYSYRGWIRREVARVVKKVRRIARRHGSRPLVLIDVPEDASLRGTRLQKTLLSFARVLENTLSWYGVYWAEERLYSSKCPKCENELTLYKKTKRTRIMVCSRCGFRADRDEVPLHWALKLINTRPTEAL